MWLVGGVKWLVAGKSGWWRENFVCRREKLLVEAEQVVGGREKSLVGGKSCWWEEKKWLVGGTRVVGGREINCW